jgi:hypothetical protein
MSTENTILVSSAVVLVTTLLTACGGGSNSSVSDSESVVTAAAPDACQATNVTWAVMGKTCNAMSPVISNGASASATDTTAPTFGSASFTCTNTKLAVNPSALSANTCMEATIQKARMFGYLSSSRKAMPPSFNAGYSIYTAAWPILDKYPGNTFQSGLFSTWMFAKYPEGFPKGIKDGFYSDVEGGLGWWTNTRFPTETPKFLMGGVALNFSSIANGPATGGGEFSDAATPYGKYGVAQLSSRLLFPPDGLNLKEGTNGELFGYGYLPLPFTEPKLKTAGKDSPTGDNSWTLFLNTENFKGPVSFFTPYFWSRASTLGVKDTNGNLVDLNGKFLDSRGTDPDKPFDIENQGMPGFISVDSKGETYARTAPVSFPSDTNGDSVVLHRHIAYNKSALWTSVQDWFRTGKAASGVIDIKESSEMPFAAEGRSSFSIAPLGRDDLNHPIEWDSFAKPTAVDNVTYGYKWMQNLVSKTVSGGNPMVTLPEYFHLVKNAMGNPVWAVVQPNEVPTETGLKSVEFKRAPANNEPAYTTPLDDSRLIAASSTWKTPGPAKGGGPFQAQLGDGSTVTYYWYRFADQPALLNADLTPAEREQLQLRVEKLHKSWKIDQNYLPSPTRGKLASVDPKLIVTPPAGLEIGYVPIVTRQESTTKAK